MKDQITILCSGFGLGFYIPGVLLKNEFQSMGYETDAEVFETFMLDSNQEHIDDSRKAYHDNFAKAIIASKIPLNIEKSIDDDKVNDLLNKWENEKRKHFISLSGHWIFILETYKARVDWDVEVDGLYVDADLAPSWKSLRKYIPTVEEKYAPVCLYNKNSLNMEYTIGSKLYTPIHYEDREKSVVIHGGGWGMGTYRDVLEDIQKYTDLEINLLAYSEQELFASNRITSYMNNPSWCAWKQVGACGFPPYGIMKNGTEVCWKEPGTKYHWLLDVTARQLAVVAKPGAGTLIDSFVTETPIVMLKPFGKHEQKNMEVWENLGFGITYEKWKEKDFSIECLQEAYMKLRNSKVHMNSYSEAYAKRLDSEYRFKCKRLF